MYIDLPLDLLPLIVDHLLDRSDWLACALVCRSFYHIVAPVLYKTLDSRVVSKSLQHHPAYALLQRPALGQFVKHVTETEAIHRGLLWRYPEITGNVLAALSLCSNLCSLTWIDDGSSCSPILPNLLVVLDLLPLRELTIRTYNELGDAIWSQILDLQSLQKLAIWSMSGPAQSVLEWRNSPRDNIQHMELGLTIFHPATIERLSLLGGLRSLRLKGAPAHSIRPLLPFLPKLEFLDTDYSPSMGLSHGIRRYQSLPNQSTHHHPPFPTIRNLTIRANPTDPRSNHKLWSWIAELAPNAGLETLKVHAFTSHLIGMEHEQMAIPRIFILDLSAVHRMSLRHFSVGHVHLSLPDIDCLCQRFTRLESLSCSVISPDVASIKNAIHNGRHLTQLELEVRWMTPEIIFTSKDAVSMMLRYPNSRLNSIRINNVQYSKRSGDGEGVTVQTIQDKWLV